MKIIKPYISIYKSEFDPNKIVRIEQYARVCYQSTSHLSDDINFLNRVISNGHESVLEHEKISVIFTIDRGIAHQIIRHRIASYSQESTRYCNYSSNKFSNQITVIEPFFYSKNLELYEIWKKSCEDAELCYLKLCSLSSPEQARIVLPNSLKTELATTYNVREWRHFFKLRTSKKAHPQMRQISIPLLLEFKKYSFDLFGDIEYDEDFSMKHYADIFLI